MYLYGIFWSESTRNPTNPAAPPMPTHLWALLRTNKRDALRRARARRALVGRVSVGAFRGGDQYGIDAPTFRAAMAVVADYRKEA
jgi:hypothetical protein